MASMVLAAAQILHEDYVIKQWHTYLLFLLILLIQGGLTIQATKFLGHMNIIGTILNVVVLVVFIIWLPVASINTPKFNDKRTVWVNMENGTEWPMGWSFIMGFLSVIWTMSGYDTPFHLSEECSVRVSKCDIK